MDQLRGSMTLMRRREFAMPPQQALALLTSLPTFHLASTLEDGTPVFRTLHGIVDDGWVAFHSAPKGEKTSLIGRPAVLCSEDSVATVPSTFFDPVKACPATTYYRSAQVHGVIEEIEEPARTARILQGLMEKLQPEGGYRSISNADHSFDPMYRAAINGLLVAGIRLERLSGKSKLAQNRSPKELAALLTSLWQRGAAGDARALELIRDANPEAEVPAFLEAPAGLRLHVHLSSEPAAREAAALVLAAAAAASAPPTAAPAAPPAATSAAAGLSLEALTRAHLASAGWVGARRDSDGALIASGRVIGDGVTFARLCDVVAAPGLTDAIDGDGATALAALAAVTRLLRDHPAARHVEAAGLMAVTSARIPGAR